MNLRNVSKRKYMHILNGVTYALAPAETKDIPEAIAKIWLKSADIVTVDDGSKDEEIKKLKEQVKKLQGAQKSDSSTEDSKEEQTEERALLLEECKKLGIKGVYGKKVSLDTIKAKIAEAKSAE